jgi:hypothetical protein
MRMRPDYSTKADVYAGLDEALSGQPVQAQFQSVLQANSFAGLPFEGCILGVEIITRHITGKVRIPMSVLLRITDSNQTSRHVRKVSITDINTKEPPLFVKQRLPV